MKPVCLQENTRSEAKIFWEMWMGLRANMCNTEMRFKYLWISFLLKVKWRFKCEQQCDCNSRDFQAHLKHKCYCLGLSLVTLYSINFKQFSELRQKGLVQHCGTVHTVLSGSGYLFESTLNMLQKHKESGYFCLILE